MRPLKTLKPIDLAVRGTFLAVVLIGGMLGQQRSQGAQQTSQAEQAAVIELGMGLPLPAVAGCQPTAADTEQSGAAAQPGKSQDYVVSGSVKSSAGCAPIGGAKIEFWPAQSSAADQNGAGITFADANGAYRFHCNDAASAAGKPGPIHMRVSADGYAPLVTRYTPDDGPAEGEFDVVLEPGQ